MTRRLFFLTVLLPTVLKRKRKASRLMELRGAVDRLNEGLRKAAIAAKEYGEALSKAAESAKTITIRFRFSEKDFARFAIPSFKRVQSQLPGENQLNYEP